MRNRILILWAILPVCVVLGETLTAPTTNADTSKKLSEYTAAIIEPVSVQKSAATRDFPVGLDLAIQDRTVAELRQKNLFDRVQGLEEPATLAGSDKNPQATSLPSETTAPSGAPPAGDDARTDPAKRARSLVVNMIVLSFDKGNTAERVFLGMGAGRSKMTVRFVLRDGESGAEVMHFEQKATWNGMTSFTGGDADDAARSVANNVVKGFIGEMAKNR